MKILIKLIAIKKPSIKFNFILKIPGQSRNTLSISFLKTKKSNIDIASVCDQSDLDNTSLEIVLLNSTITTTRFTLGYYLLAWDKKVLYCWKCDSY